MILVIACVTSVLIMSGCKKKAAEADNRLYWNVDKVKYSDEKVSRSRRQDKLYYVLFAVDGEQKELPVKTQLLADYIDTMEVMGLEFDEEGVVTGVRPIRDFYGEVVAREYYVKSVSDTQVVCSSTGTDAGYHMTLDITDRTKIYFVDPEGGPLCGVPAKSPQVNGKVTAVRDFEGNITHLYVEAPFEPLDIYWNVSRQYDSETKTSTRMADNFGNFVYTFAHNGQQEELKTKDPKVANAIDAVAAKCMALRFDENGFITEVVSTKAATGNSSFASWFHVISIDGNTVVAHRYNSGANQGTEQAAPMAADCKIYDVSGKADYVGQPAELSLLDQVHGLKNQFGEITHLFIINHVYDAGIYWNFDRKWDATNKVSTRTPDASGYYNITLAHDGKQVTVRTNDRDIVNSMDAAAARCFGLDVENGVIRKFYNVSSLRNGKQFCSWADITAIDGKKVTATKTDAQKVVTTYEGRLADDYVVYDVSSVAGMKGERTTLRVGDKVHALKGLDGKIRTIFVVSRSVNAKIYWNVSRKWDSKAGASTRKPEQDGYYHFTLAVDGKQVDLKTKDADLVKAMDGTAVKCFGLEVSGDVITRVYPCAYVKGGVQFCSWATVTKLQGKQITATKVTDGKTATYTGNMGTNCKVYNVSSTAKMVGEVTTLQVGDVIHSTKNADGTVNIIYVVTRKNPGKTIYWNISRSWDSTKSETKRTPDANGYYTVKLAVNGEQKTFKTKDKTIIDRIDGTATKCFGLDVNGDEITAFYPTSTIANGKQFCSWDEVTVIDGKKITAKEMTEGKTGTYEGELADNCDIFDVSNTTIAGQRTKLAKGDVIHALYNADGKVGTVFIVSHNVPIYWNVNRQWDSTKSATKRTPDADGMYEVVLAVGGVQKTFKTDSLDIINSIDGVATKCFGLEVSGDKITKFYAAADLADGNQFCSWDDVFALEKDGTLHAYEADVNKDGTVYSAKLSENVQIYDVSSNASVIGEKTTLHIGDRIHALKNSTTGEITVIYVVDRDVLRVSADAKTITLWHRWNGSGTDSYHMTNRKFTSNVTLDGKKYTVSDKGMYYLNSDVTVSSGAKLGTEVSARNWDTVTVDDVLANGIRLDLAGHTVTGTGDRIFYIYDSFYLLDSVGGGQVIAKYNKQAPLAYVYDNALFVVAGGTLKGGVKTTSTAGGGLIAVGNKTGGMMMMLDGTITGGQSAGNGGNIVMFKQSALYLLGGTVTGGTADKSGGGIYVPATSELSVGGSVNVTGNNGSNIYLASGAKITVDGEAPLTSDAHIGVSMQAPGVFLTDSTAAKIVGCFTGDSTEVSLKQENDDLKLATKHNHCVCGGELKLADHTSCDPVEWEPWPGADKAVMDANHYYYLTEDTAFADTLYIGSSTDNTPVLNLDLNGHNITATKRIFRVYGTLNLTDCQGTGTVSSTATGQAPAFYLYKNGGIMNLYGGTIKGSGATNNSGGVAAVEGVLNIYGGAISGGKSNAGGNLYLYSTAVINMYGGAIQNGEVTGNGGNIFVSNKNAKINLFGGTITGGKAEGKGNDIYLPAGNALTVGGTAVAADAYLTKTAEVKLGETALAEGASIGVTMEEPGVFLTDETAETVADYFTSASEDYAVAASEGTLLLKEAYHKHCVCGGEIKLGDHTTCSEATWESWQEAKEIVMDADHYYYLTEDAEFADTLYIGSAEDSAAVLNLDLNGHNITATKRVFRVYGTLNLTDCKGTGTISSTATGQAAGFFVYGTGVMNLYGGTFEGNSVVSSTSGSGIGAVGITGGEKGTLNMYGGTITGGMIAGTVSKPGYGGNIAVYANGELNLYGGEIKDGWAAGNGGNICVKDKTAKVNLFGGTVTGGKADGLGNDIYLPAGNALTVGGTAVAADAYLTKTAEVKLGETALAEGASIGVTMEEPGVFLTDETAETVADYFTSAVDGFEVTVSEKTLLLKEGAHSHCVCGGKLNGIGDHACPTDEMEWQPWSDATTLPTSGSYYLTVDVQVTGSVSIGSGTDGSAVLNLDLHGQKITSNVRIFDVYGTLNITDCKGTGSVSSSYTTKGGTCFYLHKPSGTMNLYGGNFQGSGLAATSGGIGALEGPLNIYGGIITGGKAKNGGNLYLYSTGVLNMYGGKIENGEATASGGNIYLGNKAAKVNIFGGTVTGGKAAANGGNIYTPLKSEVVIADGVTVTDIYAAG